MLATIDDETARKLDADRKAHGAAFSCVDADGTIVHIPAETMMPLLGPELSARLKRVAGERYRTARVDRDAMDRG